jgi:hypothetical protein
VWPKRDACEQGYHRLRSTAQRPNLISSFRTDSNLAAFELNGGRFGPWSLGIRTSLKIHGERPARKHHSSPFSTRPRSPNAATAVDFVSTRASFRPPESAPYATISPVPLSPSLSPAIIREISLAILFIPFFLAFP